VKWLIRAAVAALTLFLIYFVSNFPSLYERVKLDRSFPALSRYAFERTPQGVLIGSSMSFRLYEGYFKTPLRNLSIGGGSPATSLSIISSYRSLPKIIMVETNILSRPIDRALVNAFGNNPSEPFKWFRPARAVISWAYYWIKFQSEAQNVLLLPRRQPATYDISQSVNDTIKEYNGRDWVQIMRPNVEELKRLVAALEDRGCHIVLFELPSAPGVRETEYVKAAHILAKESFPGAEKWLAISDDRSELRWIDASHMDERSAIIVAQQIDRYLALVSR
jgi:hypothetical protein